MPAEAGPAGTRPAGAGRAGPVRWGRWLAVAGVLAIALVAAANLYLIAASRESVIADFSRTPPRPYALVLGSHVFPMGVPSRELAARLETGRQLYRAGLARRIIVSGLAEPGYDEPDAMAAWLERRGVAAGDVVIDRGGYRTAASMADAVAAGVQSLLVVSQRYHLPRALYLARRAGLQALGVPAADVARAGPDRIYGFVRETTARAEIILEVAARGVRGLPPDQIPTAPTS
jgi:vancomycin permeability regulator SanA